MISSGPGNVAHALGVRVTTGTPRQSILDEAADRRTTFWTAIRHLGESCFVVRLFKSPAVHDHLAIRADLFARGRCLDFFA